MNKLLISTSIAVVFVLTGCGDGDLKKIEEETPQAVPASRIMFDPSNGVLNVPSDLFYALVEVSDDGTLEMPDEIAGQADGGTPDFANPAVALGALDGWSTQHPFTFSTSHPDGVSLDAASAATPGSVRIFEGAIGGNLNDPDCIAAPPITGCKVGNELTFGVDFITQANGNDVVIVPLKPLKESTSYYVVATTGLTANGQPLKPSTTYELVRQDATTKPLSSDSQRALQGIINSYETVLTSQGGLNQDDIIFSYTYTTQSTTQIINTVKQLQIGPFAQALQAGLSPAEAGAYLPVIEVNEGIAPDAFTILAPTLLGQEQLAGLEAVGLNTCDGMIAAISDPESPLFSTAASIFPQVGAFCAASMKSGSIDLPYYNDPVDPLTSRWEAACTNGLAMQALGSEQIAALLSNGTITTGPNNDLCQAATGGLLMDLDLTNLGINDPRHVTRYSPIPAARGRNDDGTETLSVQITVPDPAVVAVLAALPGSPVTPISKPESGWPVVILQHGITSKKEDFLAITGALSIAGYATVAIDHPLHGSRGFTLENGQIVNTSEGFGGSVTDYLNLGSLLSTRDNSRQSSVDSMGLRLGLNAVVDYTGGSVDLNENSVSYVGQSLGSLTGIPAVAVANESFGETNPLAAFDSMYAFDTAVFSVPGGGTPAFLMESPSFSGLIKGSLLAASSEEFQAFLVAFATENQLPADEALVPAYFAFEAQLDEAGLAEIKGIFSSFVFAAQTITDAADPNNFANLLAGNTNFIFHEVIGGGTNDDGATALTDQVIPNSTVNWPTFAGTEPLAAFAGLSGVSSTTPGNGLVRFIAGGHSSLLDPSLSLATTTEMQMQTIAFIASGGTIVVSNEEVVAN